jgi:hypothetical protein
VAEELPILLQHLSSLPILPQHLSSLPILPQHLSFSGVRVTRSLDLCVCFVDRCLSSCTFSFVHCVVCSSSIYGFWLPLWYLQALLKNKNKYQTVETIPKSIKLILLTHIYTTINFPGLAQDLDKERRS